MNAKAAIAQLLKTHTLEEVADMCCMSESRLKELYRPSCAEPTWSEQDTIDKALRGERNS